MSTYGLGSVTTGTQFTDANTSIFTTEENGGMDQDDFMDLLIQELTHQDPLEPMDNQEFVNQMVQFENLSQMTEMTKAVNFMSSTTTDSMRALQMGMMGKAVTAEVKNPLYNSSVGPTEQDTEEYLSVSGIVDRIKFINGTAMLDIGDHQFTMDSISESWIPSSEELAAFKSNVSE